MKTVDEFYYEYLKVNAAYDDDQRCSQWASKFARAYAEQVRDECEKMAVEHKCLRDEHVPCCADLAACFRKLEIK